MLTLLHVGVVCAVLGLASLFWSGVWWVLGRRRPSRRILALVVIAALVTLVLLVLLTGVPLP